MGVFWILIELWLGWIIGWVNMAKLCWPMAFWPKIEFSQRRNLASRLEHRNLFELTVLGAPVVFEGCLLFHCRLGKADFMWSGWWVQGQAARLQCFRHSVFCDRLFILWDRTDCVQKNVSVGVKWPGGVSVGRSQTFWELQSSEKLRLGWGAHTFPCGAPILLFTVSTWNLYLEDLIHQTCRVYGLSR